MKKYLRLSPAAVVIGALRVNLVNAGKFPDKWTRPTYNGGRIYQYTIGSASKMKIHLVKPVNSTDSD